MNHNLETSQVYNGGAFLSRTVSRGGDLLRKEKKSRDFGCGVGVNCYQGKKIVVMIGNSGGPRVGETLGGLTQSRVSIGGL